MEARDAYGGFGHYQVREPLPSNELMRSVFVFGTRWGCDPLGGFGGFGGDDAS
jgi:hypothetical protein